MCALQAQARVFHLPLHNLHLVSKHKELDLPPLIRALPVPSRRRTRKYTSENSMELLPVEESACYGRRLVPDLGF